MKARKFASIIAIMTLIAMPFSKAVAQELPLVSEPVTIRLATAENFNPTDSYVDQLPVWAELEKRTGVHVEFDVLPGDQYNAGMQTRLAAARDLPDVIRIPGNDPVYFAKAGIIIPLDELIANNAPDIVKLFNDRPDLKNAMTAPDGAVYVLDSVVEARSMVNQVGIGMRKDWLDVLGLSEPETISEWYEVLTAFKNGDPNGNGQNDEIPLMARNASANLSNFAQNGLFKLGNAYGLHLYLSDGWWAGDDGIVSYEWIDPAMRDFLTEMHKWYEEGLIDLEFTTQDNDRYTAKAIGNIAGSSFNDMTMQYPQWNERMAAETPDVRWEGICPPKMASGDRYMEKENPTEGVYYAITKDCKNPDLVMQWLNYMYATEEGKILMCNFGIEGIDYTLENGTPQLTDKILKHEKGSGYALNEIGANGNFPRILMEEMIRQRFHQYPGEMAQSAKAAEIYVPAFPRVIADKEETDRFINIMTDIDTYRYEMLLGFIIGTEDLSNFDEYVEIVLSLGLEDAIAIKQAQYDRVK